MNKKAQAGPIGFIFFVLVFLILWFVWIGKWIADEGEQIIIRNNLTGFEAFFFGNINLVVMIGLILGIMGYMYFATRG